MAEYIDKEQFLASMGLTGDETKYGNRDAEHQHRSYSSYMSYEIMDCVDDSIVEEELVPVVHARWETNREDIEWGNFIKRKFCTNCGKRPHFDKETREFILSDYCHNCGARMDGD